jgi:arabinogalactan endo-1,4-beta-galactosidase
LLNAAIEGVRSVYPGAKMLLHIAGFGYSPGDVLAPAFFQSMIASGVPYDIAGLSYPYLIVPSPVVPQPYFTQRGFQNALAGIAALGKAVQLVEFNYPASPTGVIQSQSASPLYPLTPDGQANFIRDFASAVLGKVERLFYWYPDYYPTFRNGANPELESCGLFSAKDVPRLALAMLNQIAAAGIASQNDCLFNWAERQYAGYFPPGTGSGGTYPPYNYRYYPGTGNYLAVSSADNHVYVRGPSFGAGTIDVGPASTFLSLSSCS